MLQDFQRNLAAVLLGTLFLTTAVAPAGAASSPPQSGPFTPSFAKKAGPGDKKTAPGSKAEKAKGAAKATPKPPPQAPRPSQAAPGQVALVSPPATKPLLPPRHPARVAPLPVPGPSAPPPSAQAHPPAQAKDAPSKGIVAARTVLPPPSLKPAFPSAAAYARPTSSAAAPLPLAKPAFVAAMASRPAFYRAEPQATPQAAKSAFPMGFSTKPSYTPAVAIVPDVDLMARRSFWSCVPYVQQVSSVRLNGDGWRWWDNASGRYDRGKTPRPGSVLVFKRSRDLGRGHVAIVRQIIDRRTIRVDHANWGQGSQKGKIDLGVLIRDVSANNDWSMTRVWYSPINDLGNTTYPTYGFVYAPQGGVVAKADY